MGVELRHRGVVKFFNPVKGWGFIERSGEPDVFVHHVEVREMPERHLDKDQAVTFVIRETEKGPRAFELMVTT